MRYDDISLNLSPDTVRRVVAPPLEVHERRRMSRGDDVNATTLTVSVHAGTHVDAPFHFLPDGAAIDSVSLERFMGPALVHHVDTDRFITEAHVNAIPLDGVTRVLFKTRNSELLKRRDFAPDFVAFAVEAARARRGAPRGHRPVGDRARPLRADLLSAQAPRPRRRAVPGRPPGPPGVMR